jgi:hypothetical protein
MASSHDPLPEISAGDTYQYTGTDTDDHLWIVISDPLVDDNHVLVVNFTTYRLRDDGTTRNDGTCRIQPGEHPFVKEETCIQYLACHQLKLVVLEEWLDVGKIILNQHQPASSVLLRRIQQGAYDSDQTPGYAKNILIKQGLVEPF